jgi:hypothetical protein
LIGTNPSEGNHWRVKENIKIKMIPITKPGMDRPIEVIVLMNLSRMPPGLRIDNGARISAKMQESTIIKKVNSKVTGSLSPMS